MTYRPGSSPPPHPVNHAQLTVALRRRGLSMAGVQQALGGHIVSDPADRAAVARILAAFASLPPHAAAELYDYPGVYAQRFEDADPGKGG